MLNKIKFKLQKKNGETLIESLVSILIGALSIAMLVSCILASTHINERNRSADDKFNADLYRAEAALEEEGYEATQATMEIDFTTTVDKTVDVTLYGGENGSFVTYEKNAGEDTP